MTGGKNRGSQPVLHVLPYFDDAIYCQSEVGILQSRQLMTDAAAMQHASPEGLGARLQSRMDDKANPPLFFLQLVGCQRMCGPETQSAE